MLQNGVRPDGVTYSVLIAAAGKAFNLYTLHSRLCLFRRFLLHLHLLPVLFFFFFFASSLYMVYVCVVCGCREKAWAHYYECLQAASEADSPEHRAELQPSAITYINLINACEQVRSNS